jgi:hypothetical protein
MYKEDLKKTIPTQIAQSQYVKDEGENGKSTQIAPKGPQTNNPSLSSLRPSQPTQGR